MSNGRSGFKSRLDKFLNWWKNVFLLAPYKINNEQAIALWLKNSVVKGLPDCALFEPVYACCSAHNGDFIFTAITINIFAFWEEGESAFYDTYIGNI
jgi:hypothetical protein